ncbi:winged helix-turn-helix domain-containing protein [Streptococcus marmotae]|uniref:winged helix-turn-helix domain-containing protein n=1 Tax=Streptococcus marmotae TaxID=1825069 RepID=UPI00082FC129|nr:winged helix-turn-helix domain-containing protein [Streptococcus marmotae]
MSLVSEKSYIVDFLQSFSLLYEIKEWDNGQETVLDRIMDKNYQDLVRQYVHEISRHKPILSQFVTKDYNILWLFLSVQAEIRHFTDYLEGVQQVSQEQFLQLLAREFSEEGKGFTLVDLDRQAWSASSKWNLVLLQEEFQAKRGALLSILPKLYQLYGEYARMLETQFEKKIQTAQLHLTTEKSYQLIFKDYLDEKTFQTVQDQLVLLISSHKVLIHLKQPHPLLGIGVHVYDYFEEQQRQALLDEVSMQNILKVLADQTRYGIIKVIGKGMTSNKEIAKAFSISPSGVTYQLNFLVDNHIIQKDDETKQFVVNHDLIRSALLAVLNDLDIPTR